MRGFAKIIFLLLLIGFLSIIGYVVYQDFKTFQMAKVDIGNLQTIDSTYRELRLYNPLQTASIQPVITVSENNEPIYRSAFSPCVSLINDRNWEIFAGARRILPGYDQLMLYDRFWNVVWLGLKPKGSEIVDYRFYGPFRFSDVSERSFVEYLLIGRDITQDGSTFEISLSSGCDQD